MPVLTDDDRNDAIGRRRFARVGWPKHRERVGREDRQYDHRYHQTVVRFHAKNLGARSIGCHDASGGFSVATEGRTGIPSFEGRGSALDSVVAAHSVERVKEARVKSKVTIEYCTVWNYEPKAASLAARIRKTAGVTPRLIASGGGAFEIRVNGELIYSKLETGEWPDFDAIAEQIRAHK
jgi:selenoprotein W-related protein